MRNPMRDTVTCTPDILVQFIADTRLHYKLDIKPTMTNDEKSKNFELIRPIWNGCKQGVSPFPKQALGFMCLQYKSFENTVGKGEIAHNKQFLFFPTVLFTGLENFPPFLSNSTLSSANSFSLEETKICFLERG